MNDLPSDVSVLLERARRGLAPTAAESASQKLALASALRTPEGETPPSSGAGNSAGLVKLGAALALAGATGVGGYALGFRAGAAVHERPFVAATQLPGRIEPEPRPAPLAAPVASLERRSVAELRAVPAAVAPSPAPRTSDSPGAMSGAESQLEHETRILGRVDRALRNDNALLALGLLGELDREVPGGQLVEERQAARVLAHCALGSESAPRLASGFVSSHAGSAYLSRIEQACGAARASSRDE